VKPIGYLPLLTDFRCTQIGNMLKIVHTGLKRSGQDGYCEMKRRYRNVRPSFPGWQSFEVGQRLDQSL
jgi:hypothetical protein